MGQPGPIWQPPHGKIRTANRFMKSMFQHASGEIGNPLGLALALLDIEFGAKMEAARQQGGSNLVPRLAALKHERQAAEHALRARTRVARGAAAIKRRNRNKPITAVQVHGQHPCSHTIIGRSHKLRWTGREPS